MYLTQKSDVLDYDSGKRIRDLEFVPGVTIDTVGCYFISFWNLMVLLKKVDLTNFKSFFNLYKACCLPGTAFIDYTKWFPALSNNYNVRLAAAAKSKIGSLNIPLDTPVPVILIYKASQLVISSAYGYNYSFMDVYRHNQAIKLNVRNEGTIPGASTETGLPNNVIFYQGRNGFIYNSKYLMSPVFYYYSRTEPIASLSDMPASDDVGLQHAVLRVPLGAESEFSKSYILDPNAAQDATGDITYSGTNVITLQLASFAMAISPLA